MRNIPHCIFPKTVSLAIIGDQFGMRKDLCRAFAVGNGNHFIIGAVHDEYGRFKIPHVCIDIQPAQRFNKLTPQSDVPELDFIGDVIVLRKTRIPVVGDTQGREEKRHCTDIVRARLSCQCADHSALTSAE